MTFRLLKLFRLLFNPVFTDIEFLYSSETKDSTFAITNRMSFSLKAVFIAENIPFASCKPRLFQENKHVLTSKSSGLTKKHI